MLTVGHEIWQETLKNVKKMRNGHCRTLNMAIKLENEKMRNSHNRS